MEYTARDGVVITVGRVDRRQLDAVYLPQPQPPLREVETWGGITEKIPVYDDPVYAASLFQWRLRIWREQLAIIAAAVELPDDTRIAGVTEALRHVWPRLSAKQVYLEQVLDNDDRARIVEEILYRSTVTVRGVTEATERFGYTWRDKPLLTWHAAVSHGARGQLGVEWRAAIRSGLTWTQFCALDGREQSAHVAFWMLEDKLHYLLQTP